MTTEKDINLVVAETNLQSAIDIISNMPDVEKNKVEAQLEELKRILSVVSGIIQDDI
jgi:hypothetical protein